LLIESICYVNEEIIKLIGYLDSLLLQHFLNTLQKGRYSCKKSAKKREEKKRRKRRKKENVLSCSLQKQKITEGFRRVSSSLVRLDLENNKKKIEVGNIIYPSK